MVPIKIGQLPHAPFTPFEAREAARMTAEGQRDMAEQLRSEMGDNIIADILEGNAIINEAFVENIDQMFSN